MEAKKEGKRDPDRTKFRGSKIVDNGIMLVQRHMVLQEQEGGL